MWPFCKAASVAVALTSGHDEIDKAARPRVEQIFASAGILLQVRRS